MFLCCREKNGFLFFSSFHFSFLIPIFPFFLFLKQILSLRGRYNILANVLPFGKVCLELLRQVKARGINLGIVCVEVAAE